MKTLSCSHHYEKHPRQRTQDFVPSLAMKNILAVFAALILFGCTPAQDTSEPEPQTTPVETQEQKTESTDPTPENSESEMPPQVKNKPNHKVTITKFFDFACGYCRRGAQTVKYLQEKYGDDIKIEFRHFVVHPSVMVAHKALECAGEQGKFEAFFYEYFENQFAQTSNAAFEAVGKKIEMDQEEFKSCVASNRTVNTIDGHRMMGELIGVTGTPSFVINNEKKIPGALPQEQFEKLVVQYLE